METDEIKKQFNLSTSKYDNGRRLFIPCFEDYYQTGINVLSQLRQAFHSILDLGAGTGLLTKYLYEKFPDAEYTLVDIAEQMLSVSKERFKGLNNFSFQIADYSQGLPIGEFDLIASGLSIHHLDEAEKRKLYTMIWHKLPQGGCLLNLDQFNDSDSEINNAYNQLWYDHIQSSGLSEDEINNWHERKKLDKENSVGKTLQMIHEIGFKKVSCVYQYMKFATILAIK
jgi:ubiquinone/menaquinone biosynthesis C-methylase UbiE